VGQRVSAFDGGHGMFSCSVEVSRLQLSRMAAALVADRAGWLATARERRPPLLDLLLCV